MTTWGILIGPVIIAVIVGIIVCVCVMIALFSFTDEHNARRNEAKTRTRLLDETFRKTILLCNQQDDAISRLIIELEKFPASARVLDQTAVNDLYSAHGQMQQLQHEGKL